MSVLCFSLKNQPFKNDASPFNNWTKKMFYFSITEGEQGGLLFQEGPSLLSTELTCLKPDHMIYFQLTGQTEE